MYNSLFCTHGYVAAAFFPSFSYSPHQKSKSAHLGNSKVTESASLLFSMQDGGRFYRTSKLFFSSPSFFFCLFSPANRHRFFFQFFLLLESWNKLLKFISVYNSLPNTLCIFQEKSVLFDSELLTFFLSFPRRLFLISFLFDSPTAVVELLRQPMSWHTRKKWLSPDSFYLPFGIGTYIYFICAATTRRRRRRGRKIGDITRCLAPSRTRSCNTTPLKLPLSDAVYQIVLRSVIDVGSSSTNTPIQGVHPFFSPDGWACHGRQWQRP